VRSRRSAALLKLPSSDRNEIAQMSKLHPDDPYLEGIGGTYKVLVLVPRAEVTYARKQQFVVTTELQERKMSKPNKPSIVFVHGLWADGSCFGKLIPTLQAEGHEGRGRRWLDELPGSDRDRRTLLSLQGSSAFRCSLCG
jgi:hypothetical protein